MAGGLGTIDAQKDRTLSHGFSINLIAGVPSSNYGYPKDLNVDEDLQFKFIYGIQIGNRWYFGSSDQFKMGIMVNWLDITVGTDAFGNETSGVADISLLELGPVGTYALSDEMALDAYYNLRPTGFAHVWGSDPYDLDDVEGFTGAGISHAIGAAFRWKVLSAGIEYVFGNIECEDIDDGFTERLVVNNFRLMVGVKF